MNSSQQVASDAFNRIDKAMTQGLESNLRAGTFAVEMTAKAAQAAETARMNDAQITQMQQENYIRGEQFATEKAMLPLKIATMNLALRAGEADLMRQKEEIDRQNSDKIFSTFDDRVGMQLMRTENANHAKDYLGYKAQWQNHIMSGGRFDAAAYQRDTDAMAAHYEKDGIAPEGEYSYEKHALFSSVSKSLGDTYERKNPSVKKNTNGLAVGTLTMSDNDFGDFWPKFGHLYNKESSGLMGIGRSIYKQNEYLIEKKRAENSKLQSYISVGALEEGDKKMTAYQISENSKEIESAQKMNSEIMKNYSNGVYGVPEKAVAPNASDAKKEEDLNKWKSADGSVLGFPKASALDPQGKAINENVTKIMELVSSKAGTGNAKTLFGVGVDGGIDLSWFNNENRSGGSLDTKTMNDFRNRIEKGMSSIKDLSEITSPGAIDELLGNINKSVDVPMGIYTKKKLGSSTQESKSKSYTPSMGGPPQQDQQYFSFGKNGSIKSFDDIIKLTNSIRNKNEREEVTRELIASVYSASLGSAVTNK